MTDEAKALVERLREVSSVLFDDYGDGTHAVEDYALPGKAADLIETQAREIERLRAKMRSIEKGAENGQALFAERQRDRAKPIWYAVNVLQDHLAACKGTARAALAGDSHDQ